LRSASISPIFEVVLKPATLEFELVGPFVEIEGSAVVLVFQHLDIGFVLVDFVFKLVSLINQLLNSILCNITMGVTQVCAPHSRTHSAQCILGWEHALHTRNTRR
jgi:hypothetical protein